MDNSNVFHLMTIKPTFNNNLADIDTVQWTWNPTNPLGNPDLYKNGYPSWAVSQIEHISNVPEWDPDARPDLWKKDGSDIFIDERAVVIQAPYTLMLTLTLTNSAGSVSASDVFHPMDEPPTLNGTRRIHWMTNFRIETMGCDPDNTVVWMTTRTRYVDKLQGNVIRNKFRWLNPTNPDTLQPSNPFQRDVQEKSWDLAVRGTQFPLDWTPVGPRGVTGVQPVIHWAIDRSNNYKQDIFNVDYNNAPPPRESVDFQEEDFDGDLSKFVSWTTRNTLEIETLFPDLVDPSSLQMVFIETDYKYHKDPTGNTPETKIFRDNHIYHFEMEWVDPTHNPETITGDTRWNPAGKMAGIYGRIGHEATNVRFQGQHRMHMIGNPVTGQHDLSFKFYSENTYRYQIHTMIIDFNA